MRGPLTRDRLHDLMREIARNAPRPAHYNVYVVGGGTAVWFGWRDSTIDANLSADDDAVFGSIQAIKERLQLNIEFARPEHFVPPLQGSDERHLLIETIGRVTFYHYDPYAQLLAKIVRGFRIDMIDAESFLASGMVDPVRFRELVADIPESAYARYPALSRAAILDAVEQFLRLQR